MSRFVWSGEDPYESVQQHNKGTLDRFKKMIKTGSKVSIYSLCCKSNYYDYDWEAGEGAGGGGVFRVGKDGMRIGNSELIPKWW